MIGPHHPDGHWMGQKIHTQTTHNGTHKGGPAAGGGRSTFVGGGRRPPPIMGGLGMYFIDVSLYFLLFGHIFDSSNAHQEDEAAWLRGPKALEAGGVWGAAPPSHVANGRRPFGRPKADI